LYYPRRAAINWIESLVFVIDDAGDFKKAALKQRFGHVNRRSPDKKADTITLANLFSAAQYLDSLKIMSDLKTDRDRLARIAVVDWYYGIYWASNALLAAKTGTHPETHTATAAAWYRQIAAVSGGIKIPEPFSFGVDTLVEKHYREFVDKNYGKSTRPTDERKVTATNARSNCVGSLLGTADWWREKREEDVKNSKDYKVKGFTNFKKKEAQTLRDTTLGAHCCGFLHQAYRYRGKANYRDSLYFGYEDESRGMTGKFLKNMDTVLSSYLRMAACFAISRIEKGIWADFFEDLEENSWLTTDTLSILDIA